MSYESAELGRKQTQKGKDRRADNMKRCILIVLCASVLILDGFTVVHGYSGTVDQQWAPSFAGAGWNSAYAHQPILQTFTPTLPSLAGVDVGLENTGTGPEMITVQVGYVGTTGWTGAEVSAQIPVPPGGPTWLHVDCSAPVSPGQRYAIRLLADSSSAHDVRWYITIPGGGYSHGYAVTDGNNQYDGDYFFRTYGQANAPGFGFTLSLSPPSVSVKQGETANFQLVISYSDPSYSGTTITVQQVTGLGPGMNYQVIPSPPTLRILTSQSTPPGSYTIIFVGSAMGVVHETNAVLVVEPAEQPFEFSMSASPNERTISPGGSTTYTITVNLVSGSSQNVALAVSDAPSGVSPSLNPTSGSPSFNSILSVSTTSSAAPGQYVMTITGTAGAKTETTTVTLTIGQAPDFRIEVNPASETSTQGQSTSYSVDVVGLNGFNSQVSLSLSGLPAGVGGTFSVQSSVPEFSSTLTLTIPANAPTGSFTLTITGSGDGLARTANVVLVINPATTQTQTTAQTQTGTSPSGGLMEMLQENSLLIVAALIIVIIALAAIAMSRRSRPSAPQQQQVAGRVFCGKCGAENPASNEFCSSCGNKLTST
jgi:hypothetical protein